MTNATVYQQAANAIKDADAILIGASNGLSITEGMNLFADDQAFRDLFGDFRQEYGIRCILQGCGFPYPSDAEKWRFFSRNIMHYTYEYTPSDTMRNLLALVNSKPHFVVTSNTEAHFELAGFNPQNIFDIEGNNLNMQCEQACHPTLYPTRDAVEKMAVADRAGQPLDSLLPTCPRCGGPMMPNVAINSMFIHNREARDRFQAFKNTHRNAKLVVLELGIGWRNQLIKAPLMQLVDREPNATYITLNKGEVYIPDAIAPKSIGIDGPLAEALHKIAELA